MKKRIIGKILFVLGIILFIATFFLYCTTEYITPLIMVILCFIIDLFLIVGAIMGRIVEDWEDVI